MDFKALVSKINSLNDVVELPKAPELPKSIQLNEDAQLRVLAGQSSVLAEAKKMKDEKMKEAAKPDFLDIDKDGNKKEPMKKAAKDAKKSKKMSEEVVESEAQDAAREKFKAMIAKKKGSKKEVKEAAKPDFLDLDKDGNKKEPMKKAAADKKKVAMKKESAMMPKGKKRPVKESVENKLSFKDMIRLVQESGGQQQIDAVDQELFAWAQRVAATKFQESAKQEIYAGLVYERMGGVFEMYDVLAEAK